MAGHGHIRAELHVFVGDNTAHIGAGLHHRVFKEHAVLHMSALFYPNAPEQDAVADTALNIAAVGDQGVDTLTAGIDIGGGGVVFLGVYRTLGAEQLRPDLRPQQLHAALIVRLHGVDAGGKTIPHIAVEPQELPLFLQNIAPEAVPVMGHALLHQFQQQIAAQQENIQALISCRRSHVIGCVHDAAGIIQSKIGVAALARMAGAHAGHIRAGGNMSGQHVPQRQIGHQVTVRQHHIVLPDVAQKLDDASQRLHLAPEGPHRAPALTVREGGQQLQSAGLAAEIPALAGAQMIQHTLTLAVHDHANIGDTGIDHVGQHKVHHPVIAAEGQRTVDAVGGQLTQSRLFSIGEDDPVHPLHRDVSFPWVWSSMVLGGTVSFAATQVWGPNTEMPQLSGSSASSGGAPTTAFAPIWQFSPTMA